MNESSVSPTARSGGDETRYGTLTEPRPEPAAGSSGWTAGRITALVIGALLGPVSLGLLGAGGTALWSTAPSATRDSSPPTSASSPRPEWSVVVMHADWRPGIGVGADLGARMPALLWIAIGVLIAGAVFAVNPNAPEVEGDRSYPVQT